MAIVKCPSCQAKYDPGVTDELDDMPESMSLKVVCPSCGQWLRLPEKEKIDPPDVPANILREMMAQSKLVSEPPGQSKSNSRRGQEPSRSSRRDEEEDDRPRRRRDEEDDDDRPRRRRRDEDDDDRGGFDDERDDYDDSPRSRSRKADPGQGFAITAMVIGICSVVFGLVGWCCCSYFGPIVTIVLGVVAVIFGFVAKGQGSKSGMNLAGLITGFAGIAIGIIMLILLIIGIAWLQANQGKMGGGGGPGGGNQQKFK